MQQPIRVLHFIGSMTNGGAESYIMNQYRNIDRTKVQFDFLTTREGEYAFNEEIRRLGGKIYVVRSPKEQGALGYVRDIVKVLKNDKRIKVVHSHTLYSCGYSVLAGFLGGVKIRISHSHNTKKYTDGGLKRKLYQFVMRSLILTFSTNYFACGQEAGVNLYGKRYLKSKKSKFIPNSVDIDRFELTSTEQRSQLKQSLGIAENLPVYTNIGRFTEQKNHKYQLKIIKALKQAGHDFRYLMVGQGELMDDIQKLAEDMDIADKIIFTGARQDIPDILSITDLFVMPSLYEGLPVTMIEAQAAGVPCACSDTITHQADIGLDMISYIGISDDDLPKWEKACTGFPKKDQFKREKIVQQLKQLSFDSKAGAQNLCSIYIGNNNK